MIGGGQHQQGIEPRRPLSGISAASSCQEGSDDHEGTGSDDEAALDQLASDYIAAWNTHDVEKAAAFFVEDGVYEDLGPGTVARGQAEIRRYFTDTFAAFPDVHLALSRNLSPRTIRCSRSGF